MQVTIAQIAEWLNAEIEGDSDGFIRSAGKIETAGEGDIAFLANPKYEEYIYSTGASAVLVQSSWRPKAPLQTTLIRVEDPYLAYTTLLEIYHQATKVKKEGIEQPCHIAEGVEIPDGAYVGAFAYISAQCVLGKGVKIHPHVWLGEGVIIGDYTEVFSGAKLYPGTVVGRNCTLHAGVVLGSDGFGFAPQKDGSYKAIPQLGNVIVEDNVSIGANTTIDCATTGATVINEGAKLDNLVMIGHNVEIGKHTVIAAQTGIAGSTKIGDHCVLGGQVGVAGHLKISHRTTLAAQSGIMSNIAEENTVWLGSPAIEHRQFLRSYAIFRNLPDLKHSITRLEKESKSKT
jgi:UDP-3-O-[3-hydroxymyristoyl] glucosamine N-acyltransferase